MNILMIHNAYQQPGGEDQVFRQESQLLKDHGHRVVLLEEHNDRVADRGQLQLAADTIWSKSAHDRIGELIRAERIELVHAHNTFPLLSPSVYHAAKEIGVPIVQTLHNYRLTCPAATLFRNGGICEDCVGKVPWRSVVHACYRDSRPATAVTAAMLTTHRALGTYRNAVTRYIALSEFTRNKFVEAGLPAERLVVKPNFLVRDPGVGQGDGGFCLFAGRLTEEKGIRVLLEAWTQFRPGLPLLIVGQGSLESEVIAAAQQNPMIRFERWMAKDQLMATFHQAAALVLPSIWYEPFSMTILEAFATGLPVITSKLGTMVSVIDHARTGLHFEPGSASALSTQVGAIAEDGDLLLRMRRNARREFETKYTGDVNYRQLMTIYRDACVSVSGVAA
jgi:glycosyltransferase involved in cell wall biosynthesis